MLNINVSEKEVNEYVAKAILDSTLGKELEKSINAAFSDVLNGYNSPIKKMVHTAVTTQITNILETEPFKSQMTAKIGSILTQEYVDKIMGIALEKALKEMRDNNY